MKENDNAPEASKVIAEYGVANLVFVMDVDCFDEIDVMMGSMTTTGLIRTGENIQRVAMIARERHCVFDEKYKIELQGLDRDDLTIPFQVLYFSDFNTMIRKGLVNVYVQTPDGFMPIYQCVQECFTASEAKTINRMQNNFFLRAAHDFIQD